MPGFTSAYWFKGATALDEGDGGQGTPSLPTRSLRFEDGSSPELSRTYTSGATWTFACWVKRGELGATNYLLSTVIGFNASDQLFAPGIANTTELFRDPTAWLHICCSDSGLYVNGVQLSGTVSTSALTDAKIGDDFDGYLHDIYFADGTALAPVGNFIEADSTSGVYKPKVYDLSSDGSNSFHLANEAGHDAELLVTSDHNDGSTLFADSSGAGHGVAANGNTNHQDTVGTPFGSGSAIYFDGDGDDLEIADSDDFNFGSGNFTMQGWVYLDSGATTSRTVLSQSYSGASSDSSFVIWLDASSNLGVYISDGTGWDYYDINTTTLSAGVWYHWCAVRSGTSLKMYIDGTSSNTETLSSGFTLGNSSRDLIVGMQQGNEASTYRFKGYQYDIKIEKGVAGNGAEPTASFESTYIAIGADSSGNKNHFTPTNLQVHDVLPDIPTNNWCTLNESTNSDSLAVSEGSLRWDGGSYNTNCLGTFGVSSGKWYFECVHVVSGSGANGMNVGIATSGLANWTSDPAATIPSGHYWHAIDSRSLFFNNTTGTSNATGWGIGNVIGVAIDLDAATNTVTYTLDGTTVGSAQDLESGQTWFPHVKSSSYTNTPRILNFGQDGTFVGTETAGGNSDGNGKGNFYSSVPSGHLALCSANLSATIADPSKHFQAVTYSGAWDEANSAGDETQNVTTNFKPELIWIKDRDNSSQNSYYGHNWFNSILGTSAGGINPVSYGRGTSLDSGYYGVTGFNATSFTVDKADETNYAEDADLSGDIGSGDTLERYIAYCWKLGTTASSWSGSGTDPTEEKYNATAGISLLRYSNSGSGAAVTLNHSLGVAPDAAIVMDASGSVAPYLWHKSLTNAASGGYLAWASYSASGTDTDIFPSSNSTSTTFGVGSTLNAGSGTDLYIFLISEVAGFSAVGSFEASGTLPLIHTGFRPSFIWTKNIDASSFTPLMHDAAREPSNPVDQSLNVGTTAVEPYDTASGIDFLSNGFKMRGSSSSWNNYSNTTGYIAFGEQAAKYSLAR